MFHGKERAPRRAAPRRSRSAPRAGRAARGAPLHLRPGRAALRSAAALRAPPRPRWLLTGSAASALPPAPPPPRLLWRRGAARCPFKPAVTAGEIPRFAAFFFPLFPSE